MAPKQLNTFFPSLLAIFFLLSIPLHVSAFTIPSPWTIGSTTRQHLQPEPGFRARRILPQLSWLRDTAVQALFGSDPKAVKVPGDKLSLSQVTSSQLPANLLAQYGGDVVLRFNISSAAEEYALAEAADEMFLDVWEFTRNWADVRLREDDVSSLLGRLPKSLHTAYSHLMPNLAKFIYNSYPSITFETAPIASTHGQAFTPALKRSDFKTSDNIDNIFFRDYQPLSVIMPWMRLMSSMFTTHVRMISIGTSYEGRDIPALRIGVSNLDEDMPRKTIIISGGFHAREWISVSTVTYIAWSLITSYGKSQDITNLLHEFDFVLIPTVNPDGYVYTWEADRLWRKNRQQTTLRFCRGLDLDRGFGFEWGNGLSSSNPCSESYPGDEPFQAVESHRLAEWAKNETENNNVHLVGFLDLHSYSQQVLYPYSYSCVDNPPSLENLEELGMGLSKAIRLSSGAQYTVDSACENTVAAGATSRMETGGGSAIDWFYHELGVRYSYQIKLRDTGSYGFLLPKENIVPTGEEAFNAVKYFSEFLQGNKGIESVGSPAEMSAKKSKAQESVAKADDATTTGTQDEADQDFKWELRR